MKRWATVIAHTEYKRLRDDGFTLKEIAEAWEFDVPKGTRILRDWLLPKMAKEIEGMYCDEEGYVRCLREKRSESHHIPSQKDMHTVLVDGTAKSAGRSTTTQIAAG